MYLSQKWGAQEVFLEFIQNWSISNKFGTFHWDTTIQVPGEEHIFRCDYTCKEYTAGLQWVNHTTCIPFGIPCGIQTNHGNGYLPCSRERVHQSRILIPACWTFYTAPFYFWEDITNLKPNVVLGGWFPYLSWVWSPIPSDSWVPIINSHPQDQNTKLSGWVLVLQSVDIMCFRCEVHQRHPFTLNSEYIT